MKKLLQILRDWPWEYGTCHASTYSPGPARRHRINGEVQYILWRAGEQGHVKDYWSAFNSHWWPNFTPRGGTS